MPRKPRPVIRDEKPPYRDARQYFLVSEDTYAVEEYFENYGRISQKVTVVVEPTTSGDGAPQHVLARLRRLKQKRIADDVHDDNDQYWLVLDTDRWIRGSHAKNFYAVGNEAQQSGFHLAISRPCFEFWLLLHLHDGNSAEALSVTSADSAAKALAAVIGGYGKAEGAISRKADYFRYPHVLQAMERARQIDAAVSCSPDAYLPVGNGSHVYRIWEEIIRNCSAAQLPKELADYKELKGW